MMLNFHFRANYLRFIFLCLFLNIIALTSNLAQTPMEVAGTATITASSSGDWSSSTTWGGNLPEDNDRVLIPSSVTVTADGLISESFK